VGPRDLGVLGSQMDEDLTVDLAGDSTEGSGADSAGDSGSTEDSDLDSVADSGAGDAVLVLAGVGAGAGIPGGGAGVILPTHTGE
jgi:hypothetical protein